MLHYLKIENSIYFKTGLNVDTVEINFDNFQGITLIEGNNGCGKSSVIEFALPYRILPSKGDVFKSHFIDGRGSVIKTWSFNGITYDFIIKCNKIKTDYFIFRHKEDGSKESLLKTSLYKAYDTMVEQICGPMDIIVRTAFKNRDITFGNLNESDKKKFFLNIIGASMYSDLKINIGKKKSKIVDKIEFLESKLNTNKEFLSKETLEELNKKIEEINIEISNLDLEIKNINDIIEKKAQNKIDINNFENEIKILNNDIKILEEKIKEKNNELIKIKDNISSIFKKINDNEKIIEKYKNRDAIINELKEELQNINVLENDLKKNDENLKSLLLFNNDLIYKESIRNEYKSLLKNKDNKLSMYNNAIENACNIDSKTCKQAIQIEDLKKDLELNIKELDNFIKVNDKIKLENLDEEINKLKLQINNLDIKDEIKLKDIIDKLNEKINLLPRKSLEIQKELISINNEVVSLTFQNNDLKKSLEESEKLKNECISSILENNKCLTTIKHNINTIQNKIENLNLIIKKYSKSRIEEIEADKNKLNEKKIELSISVKTYKNIQEDSNIISKEIEELNQKLNKYNIADDFCSSKTGMPMLKLEAICPALEMTANDILRKFHDNGIFYQINLNTQKKDSTGKRDLNCFNIKISDNNGNNDIDLHRLSDGQKIIIELALALSSVSYYSDNQLKTLLLDELDGSLDEENRELFFKTLQTIIQDLDVEQIFLVTHSREIKNLGNSKIQMVKGQGIYE